MVVVFAGYDQQVSFELGDCSNRCSSFDVGDFVKYLLLSRKNSAHLFCTHFRCIRRGCSKHDTFYISYLGSHCCNQAAKTAAANPNTARINAVLFNKEIVSGNAIGLKLCGRCGGNIARASFVPAYAYSHRSDSCCSERLANCAYLLRLPVIPGKNSTLPKGGAPIVGINSVASNRLPACSNATVWDISVTIKV